MTNSKKDSELREWLADFATGQQGDTYYTTSPDDVSDSDIEELKQIIATRYITKEESDRRVLEAKASGLALALNIASTTIQSSKAYREFDDLINHAIDKLIGDKPVAELRELLNGDKE